MEIVENICPHCNEHLFMNKKSFANHVRWCKCNPKYNELKTSTINKIKEKYNQRFKDKHGELKEFKVVCHKCGKEFTVKEYENDFPTKERYYCSISCGNSHKHSQLSKEKTKQSLLNYRLKNKTIKKYNDLRYNINTNDYTLTCKCCGKEFTAKRIRKYCSSKCQSFYKYFKSKYDLADTNEKRKIIYDYYRRQCYFTFSLKTFPNEFDFLLIEKYGWYKAKNRGNNLNGISRDHKYSINEAIKNKIDPYYISHPANCQLMRHNDNVSKLDKSSITKEDLYRLVDEWNLKYGVYENKCEYELLKDIDFDKKFEL